MTPQCRRYHGNRIEQPPTHAQKANLKGQTQLECRAPPIFDQLPLCQRERKEGLDLESGQFPRQLFQTQKSRLPVVHRTILRPGAIASPKSPTASVCSTKTIEKSTLQLPRNPTVCYCTKNEGTPNKPASLD